MYLKLIYIVLIFSMILLSLLRIFFAERYFKKIEMSIGNSINEEEYTVIQPILSGDPRLREDLNENLKKLSKMRFLWLIDRSDTEARNIVMEISGKENYSNRIEILEIEEVPQEVNPKIFKLNKAIKKVRTKYTIILDDDSIIDTGRIKELSIYEKLEGEWLATGIPYNYGVDGFWSELVASFVNSNSITTYFTMSYLEKNKTINGMFYIANTDIFKKYNVFEKIKYWLCDDFALAQYLISKKVTLIQTGIFCNTRTTVKTFEQYLLLMKRWLLFTKIYIKNAATLRFIAFILIPSILPSILLIIGIMTGIGYISIILTVLLLKSLLLYRLRFRILKKEEGKKVIIKEVINDFIILFIFIYSIVTGPVIKWRNKKIRVIDGKIRYEKL